MRPVWKTRLADASLVLTAFLWGTTFVIVKGAVSEVHPMILIGYRLTTAAFVIGIVLLILRRSPLRYIKQGLVMALVTWILYFSQTVGLQYTSASNSGFITGLFVLFVPLYNYLFLRKRPTPMQIVAVFISLFGLWLLTGGIASLNIGDAITLISAATYAMHVFTGDRFMKQGCDAIVLSFQQLVVAGILSFITAGLFGLSFHITSVSAQWAIGYLAVFPTACAFVMQLIGQRFTSSLKVSLIFALEPVFGALFAWTIGGEQFMVLKGLGGLCIVAGMIIAELPVLKKS